VKWPQEYGEQKFVIVFGGLHIEMAALKTLCDWLQESRCVQVLVQAEITSAGAADSFLQASHISQEGTSGYSSSTVDAAEADLRPLP